MAVIGAEKEIGILPDDPNRILETVRKSVTSRVRQTQPYFTTSAGQNVVIENEQERTLRFSVGGESPFDVVFRVEDAEEWKKFLVGREGDRIPFPPGFELRMRQETDLDLPVDVFTVTAKAKVKDAPPDTRTQLEFAISGQQFRARMASSPIAGMVKKVRLDIPLLVGDELPDIYLEMDVHPDGRVKLEVEVPDGIPLVFKRDEDGQLIYAPGDTADMSLRDDGPWELMLPDWARGREVTGEKAYKMATVATKGYPSAEEWPPTLDRDTVTALDTRAGMEAAR